VSLNPPGLRNIDISAAVNATSLLSCVTASRPLLDQLVIGNLCSGRPTSMRRARGAAVRRGVERQIGSAFVAPADVIGSVTDHLAVIRNINQPPPAPTPTATVAIRRSGATSVAR
jgi:hypothetical protein